MSKEYCPNCGSMLTGGDRCMDCGTVINAKPQAAPIKQQSAGKVQRADAWIDSLSFMQKISLGIWLLFWGYLFYQTYSGYLAIIF